MVPTQKVLSKERARGRKTSGNRDIIKNKYRKRDGIFRQHAVQYHWNSSAKRDRKGVSTVMNQASEEP